MYYNISLLSCNDLPDADNDLFRKSYSPEELEKTYALFISFIGNQLQSSVNSKKIQKPSIEDIIINIKLIDKFMKKLFILSCPKLLKFNIEIQQLYLLHVFSVLLIKYNDDVLKIEKNKFLEKIYLPNILILCAKRFVNARRFIRRLMQHSYNNLQKNVRDVIEFSDVFQELDSKIIHTDVMGMFFGNVLYQFDPMSVIDVDAFYSLLLYDIFFTYIKSRINKLPKNFFDLNSIQDKVMSYLSERSRIYGEAFYLAQLQEMCNASITTKRISQCYDELKSIILPHELQKLFIFAVTKGQLIVNNRMLLMRTNNELQNNITFFKQKTPNIYKLLKSIHVKSEESHIIDTEHIKNLKINVYNILYDRFKNILDDDIIASVIRSISVNLVESLFIGDFIDVVTMVKVNTSSKNITNELTYFLNYVLTELSVCGDLDKPMSL